MMMTTRIVGILKIIVLLICIGLICGIASHLLRKPGQIEETISEGHFWVLSDSHVDILYRTDGDPATRCRNVSVTNASRIVRKFGHFNCDAPVELLTSAFSAANRIDPDVDFLIWLGDATSHLAWQKDTILPVNAHFSEQLRKHFPTTLVIPVLGNHDILLKANHTTRFEEFYDRTKYHRLLKDADARRAFRQGNRPQAQTDGSKSGPILLVCSSLLGGYYFLRYQPIKRKEQTYLRFVVLNTAMYQPQHLDSFGPNEAQRQIDWFNKTMADASKLNDRVLLLAHTPFGLHEGLLYKFYHIEWEQKLLSIIHRYTSQIIMCFSGHRHQDTFRLYSSSHSVMGILGHPSITPISSLSHPSIRHYSYQRQAIVLSDYDQYALNLLESERTGKDQWELTYRFSSWYHQSKGLTSASLLRLVYYIRTESFYLKRFLLTKHYSEETVITNQQIIKTLCALTLMNFDEWILCTNLLHQRNQSYDTLIMNNSLEINAHRTEQLMEYRTIYRRVVLSLLPVFSVIALIIYRISGNCFSTIICETQ